RDAERRPGLVERAANIRHPVRDRDHGTQRREAAGLVDDEIYIREAQSPEHALDVMIVVIELENLLGMRAALLADDRLKQLLLALEIDIERALRHARCAGDLSHTGRIETLRQEHTARALDDLTPLGAVIGRQRGRRSFEFLLDGHSPAPLPCNPKKAAIPI